MASSDTTRLIPVFGRLFWMMVGPIALVMATYFIVSSGGGWMTTADLLCHGARENRPVRGALVPASEGLDFYLLSPSECVLTRGCW
jgi:hypothetical protein